MLLGFKVKNFKSFKNLQHFSMIASKVRSNENHITEIKKNKILKFSGIYGANGSGKSNLILAMSIVQEITRKGVSAIINNLYFRGNEICDKQDSYFEYELVLNNKLYSYGFEINISRKEIVSEWLIDMTKSTEKIIFERDLYNNTFSSSLKTNDSIFTNCLLELKNNRSELFLKEMFRRLVMSSNNNSVFDDITNVYRFLMFDMIIVRPQTHKLLDIDYIKNEKKILKILNSLDINIVDIVAVKSDISNIEAKLSKTVFINLLDDINAISSKYSNASCTLRIENDLYTIKKDENNNYIVQTLKFIHKNCNSEFGAYEESDGTIRILELIDILLSNNKLFLIDELDSSLHPVLVDGLLKMFLNSNAENQLIITTHELKTMDFDLVRRDEIWFTEKSEDGDSKIYSLEEFKDVARFDRKIDKAYLEGRFGAIANIDIIDEN